VRCQNVNIRGLTIITHPIHQHGWHHPDSCRYVRISDCYISVGDDCITIKSGTPQQPRDQRVACRDIAITNARSSAVMAAW